MNDKDQLIDTERAALQHHLDAYGPDFSRWPLQSQQRFAVLMATDGEAQRRLGEATALEQAIRAALAGESAMQQQSDSQEVQRLQRLKAAVMRQAQREAGPAIPAVADLSEMRQKLRQQPAQPAAFALGWPAAAALAASLVLGIFAGTQDFSRRILPGFASGSWTTAAPEDATDDDLDDIELALDTGLDGLDESSLDVEEGTL